MSVSMTRTELYQFCGPSAYNCGAAFNAFFAQMENRRYGQEETIDAWLWFLEGWNQCKSTMADMINEGEIL